MWNIKQSATVKKMRWTAVPVAMALFGSVTAFAVKDANETNKPEFTKVVER